MPDHLWQFYGAMLLLAGLCVLVQFLIGSRRRDGVDEAYETAAAVVNSQSCDCEKCDGKTDLFHHDDFAMTDDERAAEVRLFNQWIGPLRLPGGDF